MITSKQQQQQQENKLAELKAAADGKLAEAQGVKEEGKGTAQGPGEKDREDKSPVSQNPVQPHYSSCVLFICYLDVVVEYGVS